MLPVFPLGDGPMVIITSRSGLTESAQREPRHTVMEHLLRR